MAEELWHLSCLQQEGTTAMKEATLQGEPVPVLTHPRGHHHPSYLQPHPVPAGPTVEELWGQGWVAGGCVQGGEMSVMHKKTCRNVVTAKSCCSSGRAPNEILPLARSSSPVHPPGLAAVTQKMSQCIKSLEGKRRKGLKIKLHEVEEQ